MNDPNEYIEAYFEEQLNDAEKKLFEERCIHDESFAREVAFYITSREAIRQKLLEQKKQQWEGDENKVIALKKAAPRRWFSYVVAACFLLAIGLYFLNSSNTPQQLANKYVKEHFKQLSQTMDASGDSLQQGIAAYNDKDYPRALQVFEKIYQSHPENGNALKHIGLVYLVTNQYDKALRQFDELANKPGIYRNPGLFLMAVTLLERNREGDKEKAKLLLEQVVAQKEEGSREAQTWLKKF